MKSLPILKFSIPAGLLAVALVAGAGYSDAVKTATKELAKEGETMSDKNLKAAVFAGGCFWCLESDLAKLDGVSKVVSGYTGGHKKDPTYQEVSAGGTGHLEAVRVAYDPERIDYETLVGVFFRHIDPTDAGGQFVDRGDQYRSAIFYADEDQRRVAEASRAALAASGQFDKPVVTEILPLGEFYVAEDHHQDYYKNNPIRYKLYRYNSGRDQFIGKVWGDKLKDARPIAGAEKTRELKSDTPEADTQEAGADEARLRETLTPMQFKVTRQEGTEPPFQNEYWDNKKPGIYVDIVSGEPLFSSTDKFDSGTGWPSFTRPLEPENIVEKQDQRLFMTRTEARGRRADSHLGHVFDDGPAPTGLRYCINSAALRFVPAEDLEKEGYEQYLKLFQ